jgi:hypothetical protein
MYYYKIGWSWYEDYSSSEFMSETYYTKEELNGIVIKIIEDHLPELIEERNDNWIGNNSLIDMVVKHLPEDFNKVIPVEYTAEYNLWGSCIIEEEDHEYDDELPSKVLEKIHAHNNKIRDRLELR